MPRDVTGAGASHVRNAGAAAARLSRNGPWSVVIVAMAAIGAVAWLAGLSKWLVIAIELAVLLAGALVAASRVRRASPAPMAGRITSPDGDFDLDEVIAQDTNSGRIWRLRDVHFLGAAEKRRLAAERPHVWQAYRARLFPLPQTRSDDGDPRTAAPPRGGD
jgi:hypothetical protein